VIVVEGDYDVDFNDGCIYTWWWILTCKMTVILMVITCMKNDGVNDGELW